MYAALACLPELPRSPDVDGGILHQGHAVQTAQSVDVCVCVCVRVCVCGCMCGCVWVGGGGWGSV